MRTACHSSLPPLGNLMNFTTELFTDQETPVLLHPPPLPLVDIPVRITPSDPVVKLTKVENKTSVKETEEHSPVQLVKAMIGYTRISLSSMAMNGGILV